MDNLAHTLVGAALGRAVADRKVPAAGWIGAIAGNAPDWSELVLGPANWAPRAGPGYLVEHRGITHSLLGAGIEIAALSGLVGLLLEWWARRHASPRPAWGWIVACVAAAVASHLYLDWQGSYGLRPLLPWSGRWYYGDWVAIVDPLFWMVPLVALGWGARRHWAPALVYLVVLAGVLTLVLGVGRSVVVWWLKLVVMALAVTAVLGWTRHWAGVAGRRRAALAGLLVLAAYAAASGVASAVAQAQVRAAAIRRFGPGATWAAFTVVGHPFTWELVSASVDSIAGPDWTVPRHLADPAVRRALATPGGQAMAEFARFLAADVDSSGGGLRVYLRDARFRPLGRGGGGFATATVVLR
jgi:inner membrane protein